MCNDSGSPINGSSPSNITRPQNPSVAALKSGKPASSSTTAMTASKPQDDAAEPTQEYFRLLDLPPELVVRVLEYAVIISSRERELSIHAFSGAQPAITRTCRWLRAEGLKIYYPRNHFVLSGTAQGMRTLWRWYAAIGQEKASKVEHLFVNLVDGRGLAEDPHELIWKWWLEEVVFFKGGTVDPDHTKMLQVRMKGEKVMVFPPAKVTSAFQRYQLSFNDRPAEPECWRKWEEFPTSNPEYDAEDIHREDWWTWAPY